jgi:hypothetical protein
MTIAPPAMVKNGVFIRCTGFSGASDWLCSGILSLSERNASRIVTKGSVVRVLVKRSGVGKKPVAYPLRHAEHFFFDGSNEVAAKPSECATGNQFSPPC